MSSTLPDNTHSSEAPRTPSKKLHFAQHIFTPSSELADKLQRAVTRSQLTLPDHILSAAALDRSPLKAARARATNHHRQPSGLRVATLIDSESKTGDSATQLHEHLDVQLSLEETSTTTTAATTSTDTTDKENHMPDEPGEEPAASSSPDRSVAKKRPSPTSAPSSPSLPDAKRMRYHDATQSSARAAHQVHSRARSVPVIGSPMKVSSEQAKADTSKVDEIPRPSSAAAGSGKRSISGPAGLRALKAEDMEVDSRPDSIRETELPTVTVSTPPPPPESSQPPTKHVATSREHTKGKSKSQSKQATLASFFPKGAAPKLAPAPHINSCSRPRTDAAASSDGGEPSTASAYNSDSNSDSHASSTPTSSAPTFKPKSLLEHGFSPGLRTPHRAAGLGPSLSPLTPLPHTPFGGGSPFKMGSSLGKGLGPGMPRGLFDQVEVKAPSSRLPRPPSGLSMEFKPPFDDSEKGKGKMDPPPVPIHRLERGKLAPSTLACTATVGGLAKVKKEAPRLRTVPVGGERMTRSAALRLKKRDDAKAAAANNASRKSIVHPSTPSAAAGFTFSFAAPTSSSVARMKEKHPSSVAGPSSRPASPVKQRPSSPIKSHSSSSAISPTKRPGIMRAASVEVSSPSMYGIRGPVAGNKPSSLSTLESALRRLEAPKPQLMREQEKERPGNGVALPMAAHGKGAGGSAEGHHKGKEKEQRSSLGLGRPSTLQRASSVGAIDAPAAKMQQVKSLNGLGQASRSFTAGGMAMRREGARASMKTSLPPVAASPRKERSDKGKERATDTVAEETETEEEEGSGDGDVSFGAYLAGEGEKSTEKARGKMSGTPTGSHMLTQSLNFPPPTAPATTSRAVSSTFPHSGVSNPAAARSAPQLGRSAVGGATEAAGTVGKVLAGCTVFVDVRTESGEDAGGLFVDMLRGMGAKILGRAGQTCTHIVYKNGLMSTITRYRLMHEPRPSIVGIAWVVECVEQRARVDEAKFLVDLEHVGVAGMNKRRKSMMPKSVDMRSPMSMSSDDMDEDSMRMDQSVETSFSSTIESDDGQTRKERDGLDGLPPLERARRRKMMLTARF